MTTELQQRIKPLFTIFLDIDGVLYNDPNPHAVREMIPIIIPQYTQKLRSSTDGALNAKRIRQIAATHFFDKKAVENLDTIINESEKTFRVQIVVSSMWRIGWSVDELKNILFSNFTFSKYIVDKTIETLSGEKVVAHCTEAVHFEKNAHCCRAAEIQQWLNQHPEITNYAIIDDNDDDTYHLSKTFKYQFFQTKIKTLLTKDIAEKIVIFAQTNLQ